jgi:hypothetical protein
VGRHFGLPADTWLHHPSDARRGAAGLRLRLAEAAAHRRGLKEALKPYRETVNAALVHLDVQEASGRVIHAIQAKVQDTKDDIADMQ